VNYFHLCIHHTLNARNLQFVWRNAALIFVQYKVFTGQMICSTPLSADSTRLAILVAAVVLDLCSSQHHSLEKSLTLTFLAASEFVIHKKARVIFLQFVSNDNTDIHNFILCSSGSKPCHRYIPTNKIYIFRETLNYIRMCKSKLN
jgi:hypothetical protein